MPSRLLLRFFCSIPVSAPEYLNSFARCRRLNSDLKPGFQSLLFTSDRYDLAFGIGDQRPLEQAPIAG